MRLSSCLEHYSAAALAASTKQIHIGFAVAQMSLHHPVRMAEHHVDALRGLRAIYIDAGNRDQFFLDLGAQAFRRALERIGVTDVFFELFDATHDAIEYRYPIGIKYLADRLTP